MKKFRRALAALLVFLMVMQPAAFAASVTDFLDFPSDWSKDAMTAAVENGLYIGNESKLIQPGKALTRAELAAFITRAFGATRKADISMLTDVSETDWFYEPVAEAYQMGALTGTSDTTFDPNAYITREQVFLVLARILCISGTDEKALTRFTDASDISSWAKNGIIGLASKGYVNGYPNGSFRPKDNISRAELAQVFFNIFKTYIDHPGYYSEHHVASEGSIMIRVPGVHLENTTVNGDVVIADGVADGDFDITTVTVNGRVLARGGEGKVTFKDVTMNGPVVVYDNNGTVNFNNYRTDAPFKNLEELTPATFLTRSPDTSYSGSSGGSTARYYTVTFYEADGTTVFESSSVRSGKTVDKPSMTPANVGYTFLYWSTAKEASEGAERPEFDFSTKIRKVYKLYPVYGKNPTVTFYDKDGTALVDLTKTITYNTAVDEPTAPAVEGHTFKHWSETPDGTNAFDFTTKLKADKSLYAVYTVNEYTVVFEDKDGNTFHTENVQYGNTVAEPATKPAAPTDKKFAHWSVKDTTTPVAFPYEIKKDTTFVPNFVDEDKDIYTITLKIPDQTDRTLTVIEGNFITGLPTDISKSHHTFEGWFTEENGAGTKVTDGTYKPTGSMTLYAYLKPIEYTVTFVDGATGTFTKHFDEKLIVPAYAGAAPAGQHFKQWKSGTTIVNPGDEYTVVGNITFTAEFEDDEVFYTVTFTDGATEVFANKKSGDKITVPAYAGTAPDGQHFKQWKSGTTIVNPGDEYTVVGNITFTAEFEDDEVFYTVTFTDGATPVFANKKNGDKITVPAYAGTAPAGQHFKQWKSGTTIVNPGNEYTVVGNITFTAEFEDDEVIYTVTFYDEPASILATVSVPYNTTIPTASIPDPGVEPGYVLDGSVAGIYSTAPYSHTVKNGWWVIEGGKWVEYDPTKPVTANLNVYNNSREVRLSMKLPDKLYTSVIPLHMNYNSTVRAFDTLKDAMYTQRGSLSSALGSIQNTLYNNLKSRDLITADNEIKNIDRHIKLVDVLGESNIRKIIGEVVSTSIDRDESEQYIRDFVHAYPTKSAADKDKAVSAIKTAFEDILKDSKATAFSTAVKPVLVDVLSADENDAFAKALLKDAMKDDRELAEKIMLQLFDESPAFRTAIRTSLSIPDTVTDPVLRGMLQTYISTPGSAGYDHEATVDVAIAQFDATSGFKKKAVTMYLDDILVANGTISASIIRTMLEFTAGTAHEAQLESMIDSIFDSLAADIIVEIAADLGQTTASDRVNAVNAFIDQLCHNDTADVTSDNLFLYEPIYDMLITHGWDFFEAKLPEKIKSVLPTAKIKELYERHYTPYVDAMKSAMDAAELGTPGSISTGITIKLNPVSDLMIPMFDFVKDIKGRAEAKADASTRAKLKQYYDHYKNNPYKDAYEEFLTADKWLTGSDNGWMTPTSGYKLKSIMEYYDVFYALIAVSDDMVLWFYDPSHVPEAEREAVFDTAEDYVLDVANIINNHLVDFATNGIPATLEEFCESIETDPVLLDYLKKFGVDAYLTKLEDNATAGKVYATAKDKVYARFSARIEALLDKYASSKLNRTYTDAEYEQVKELLHGLFTNDTSAVYSVDVIFDKYFDGLETKTFKSGDNFITFVRQFFYEVEDY